MTRPELEEIFELIHSKVTAFALNNVVISGCTSQMPNTHELAEYVVISGCTVRCQTT